MRLLFTSLIISSTNVSVIVIIRITHGFPAPSEPSLQCIGSSSNDSDSRENIKIFDRLNRLNFARFASTEDTAIQTATLIFSRRPHRPLVIAYVGHRVKLYFRKIHFNSSFLSKPGSVKRPVLLKSSNKNLVCIVRSTVEASVSSGVNTSCVGGINDIRNCSRCLRK
jgi:hypothetical protein